VSVANMISTGLFGDGAAAAVIAGHETDFQGPESCNKSVFYPDQKT